MSTLIDGNDLIARANRHKDLLLQLKTAVNEVKDLEDQLLNVHEAYTRLGDVANVILNDYSLKALLTPEHIAALLACRTADRSLHLIASHDSKLSNELTRLQALRALS